MKVVKNLVIKEKNMTKTRKLSKFFNSKIVNVHNEVRLTWNSTLRFHNSYYNNNDGLRTEVVLDFNVFIVQTYFNLLPINVPCK